jgi:hypothetical protein
MLIIRQPNSSPNSSSHADHEAEIEDVLLCVCTHQDVATVAEPRHLDLVVPVHPHNEQDAEHEHGNGEGKLEDHLIYWLALCTDGMVQQLM